MQDHAADQLHVEVPQAERAPRRLAYCREGFGEDVVHGLAGGQLLAELARLVGEVGVAERLHCRLEGVHLPDETIVLTDEPLVATAENAGEPIGHGGSGEKTGGERREFYSKVAVDQPPRYRVGFTALPFRSTSKCTCVPVERPVLPMMATAWPFWTASPSRTRLRELWP